MKKQNKDYVEEHKQKILAKGFRFRKFTLTNEQNDVLRKAERFIKESDENHKELLAFLSR